METITISNNYNITYWVTDNICKTNCGKFINAKLGKEVKQFLNGSKKAIYINRIAVNIEDLKPIKKEVVCPF
jgi:hypothetical protein